MKRKRRRRWETVTGDGDNPGEWNPRRVLRMGEYGRVEIFLLSVINAHLGLWLSSRFCINEKVQKLKWFSDVLEKVPPPIALFTILGL